LIHPIPSTAELKEAIEQDALLKAIRQVLLGETTEVQVTKKQARFLTKKIEEFFIRDGTLYHEDGQGRIQLVLPTPYREAVMHAMHDAVMAGHLGVFKTTARVRKFYFWHGMLKQIKDYVNKCAMCQRAKPAPSVQTEAKAVTFKAVFETLAIDLLGPLPATPQQDREYKYILTAQCCASKYLFAILREQTTTKIICEAKNIPTRLRDGGAPESTDLGQWTAIHLEGVPGLHGYTRSANHLYQRVHSL
jgi:hypothetical protein